MLKTMRQTSLRRKQLNIGRQLGQIPDHVGQGQASLMSVPLKYGMITTSSRNWPRFLKTVSTPPYTSMVHLPSEARIHPSIWNLCFSVVVIVIMGSSRPRSFRPQKKKPKCTHPFVASAVWSGVQLIVFWTRALPAKIPICG